MAQIALKSGGVALVDDEDLALTAQFKWREFEPVAGYVYVSACKAQNTPLLHRLITGAGKGFVVDHINGDPLDNRRANLRVCTHAENMLNRRKSVRSLSQHKGVRKLREGCWEAAIGSHSPGATTPRTRLGKYSTEEEAASVYDIAAVLRYGRFACLNFPHVFPELSSRKA